MQFEKKSKVIVFSLLCLTVLIGLKQRTQSSARQSITQAEDSVLKKEEKPKAIPISSKSEAVVPEMEALEEKERKKKRQAYRAKRDECNQIEEDLKRPEREHFKKKVISAISSDIGDWFYNKRAPSKELDSVGPVDKLFRAAALSGGLKSSAYFNYDEDIPTALKLADEFILADPTNSAGYLLKARLLDSQNKTQEAQEVLHEAEQKTHHFDTGMLSLRRKILDVTDGAADMLLANELQAPLLGVSSLLIEIIEKYKKIKLGQQIMKPAYDKSKLIAELEWSSWDYQNAKYALEKITGNKLPDHLEIHPQKYKILAQQFPEFDPSKQPELDKDRYQIQCVDTSEMEKQLFLVKKAIARAK